MASGPLVGTPSPEICPALPDLLKGKGGTFDFNEAFQPSETPETEGLGSCSIAAR